MGKKITPGQKIKIITSKHNFFKDWDLKIKYKSLNKVWYGNPESNPYT
jgi:hypothetical protein